MTAAIHGSQTGECPDGWSPELVFECPICERQVCYCMGGDSGDGLFALCNDCWVKVRRVLKLKEQPPAKPIAAPRVVILDLETGGLDPRQCDIVEFAALELSPGDQPDRVLATGRVRPELPVEAGAARVNGFELAGWYGATTQRDALRQLGCALQGAYVAGSNPQFDWGFIVEGCRRYGLRPPKLASRHLLDVPSMAHEWLIAGLIPACTQSALMSFFELGTQTHTALGDVEALASVYRKIMARVGLNGGTS